MGLFDFNKRSREDNKKLQDARKELKKILDQRKIDDDDEFKQIDNKKTKNDSVKITLKVGEPELNDVGHNVAKIDYTLMKTYGWDYGDILEIRGKRITVAKCSAHYHIVGEPQTIRIDGITRQNLEVNNGDWIQISKISAFPAKEITIKPLKDQDKSKVSKISSEFISNYLRGSPVIYDDILGVAPKQNFYYFIVIETNPSNVPVIIQNDTVFKILDYDEILTENVESIGKHIQKPIEETVEKRVNENNWDELDEDAKRRILNKKEILEREFQEYHYERNSIEEELEENYVKTQEIFNKHVESFPTKDYNLEQISEKQCHSCNTKLIWPDIHDCYFCNKQYCSEHRLPENHECPKVMAAQYIEKDYLRKKGVNITSSKFAVVCKNCGYESEYSDIETVNKIRIEHIKKNGCESGRVQLRQNESDRILDDSIQKTYPTNQSNMWMYGCLEDAKRIVQNHHNGKDMLEFFREAKFSISIQDDREDAYGYINGTFPFYRIGIHKALEKNSPESHKMVTVVLIHEILHALHDDWTESQVQNEERRLANLGMHYDALQNLDVLYLSGKMRLCGD